MKHFAITAALLLCGTAAASAADLYVPQTPMVVMDEAGHDWSGFYIGATIGGQNVRVDNLAGSIDDTAAVGGAFIGGNYQSGNFVYGAEADLEYGGYDTTVPCNNPAFACNTSLDWQGSLRVRAGYAVDSLLFYGTGGLALARFDGSTNNGVNFPDEETLYGFTIGAGVEAAFTDNLFGRLEYRYTRYADTDFTFDVTYPDLAVSSHTVRVGLGYKF